MSGSDKIPPQVAVTDEMRAELRGSLAEIDPAQMAIIARLTPAERARQALTASEFVLGVAVAKSRQEDPDLTELEAKRLALELYYRRNPSTYLPRAHET